ncbi:MAG: pyrrolo-quinoline quinone [Planctomycetaceae bacterium]|nr:pyrrolo-quinoline quinone [Planctomycetaceae bacterium]
MNFPLRMTLGTNYRASLRAGNLMTALALLALSICEPAKAEDWPQFRGLHGNGVSQSKQALPVEVGPEKLVKWKATLPPGHSSPVLSQDRIFLTGVDQDRLLTIALDRISGKVLWQQPAPYDKPEKIHNTGNLAQSSAVTDGEIVVTFFGSSGLHAYTKDGKHLWSHRMGPFKNDFGAGSSPIIEDNYVILTQDHDVDSFIAAYDKKTGTEIWRTDRSEFMRSYASPTIWTVNGKKEIVAAATLRIVGYDFETGKEKWTVKGVSRLVNMTPIVGPDNTLYAACWSPGGEGDDRIVPPPVEELFASDTDKNGTLEEGEFPENPLKRRFSQIDRNKDGHITRQEYQSVALTHSQGRNVVLAIAPGGSGDITKSHVRWEYTKQIPYCPSPLLYRDALYMVKDGGILSILSPESGKALKQFRLQATGNYYASPVAGDGKVYLMSQNGELTVLAASEGWKELYTVKFEADGHATPAIADGRLYVRVGDKLYCFGLPDQTASVK